MYAIFAIVLQKLVQWTLDNVHWKTFNRPIWFSGRWFLSSWYFQFTLRYSPLSLWYFQYWKSIWKQHDNDCLPLLKWDVKPLSHCCLSCLRSFNQFSKTRLADFIQPKNCEISNSGGNIFCIVTRGIFPNLKNCKIILKWGRCRTHKTNFQGQSEVFPASTRYN